MAHAPSPLTPVLFIHLFVQRVQLWANSDHRQGPGPGVRSDFITPDVRAKGDREGGGDRLTEKGWRGMTGSDMNKTGKKRRKRKFSGYFASLCHL